MLQNYWLVYQKIFEFILTRVHYATSDHSHNSDLIFRAIT